MGSTSEENKPSVASGSGFGREQPETVAVQAAVPLPQAPEPEQPPAEPEQAAEPVQEGSPHQSLTDGPSGATGWCEGCQQYCGGSNQDGDPIRCNSHPN